MSSFARGNGSYSIVAKLGTVGKILGPVGAVVGLGFDASVAFGNPTAGHIGRAGLNAVMVGVGLFGGPPGEIVAGLFFAGEFAYDMDLFRGEL